ncbi:hypothetical protein QN363_13435 [Undibacterium sp. CCC2.1]|uniref:hypothetical protein n=1 Tax=unclassified Undibacterium TaxID=2630295 RepID=UPI002B222C4F|nr:MULTISPECIES: hypothetical protein [unclassified Undibacterium]MEB0140027.1 hypothetical protein [Undibacterium sp. CCC2.1]MEB0173060.1 hypothetical protein [Undibacterium sp. CCC1.1]MEB0176872.1 hypothetical protein [Undibacterium sp. CCC3.4]MEB0216104.1 hypothetical protein [Undibacterium sp. 5I2]
MRLLRAVRNEASVKLEKPSKAMRDGALYLPEFRGRLVKQYAFDSNQLIMSNGQLLLIPTKSLAVPPLTVAAPAPATEARIDNNTPVLEPTASSSSSLDDTSLNEALSEISSDPYVYTDEDYGFSQADIKELSRLSLPDQLDVAASPAPLALQFTLSETDATLPKAQHNWPPLKPQHHLSLLRVRSCPQFRLSSHHATRPRIEPMLFGTRNPELDVLVTHL